MVSVNPESVAATNSPHFHLNSEIAIILLASMALSILVFIITSRWRKHKNPKVEEYLKKSDISASDTENRTTIQTFLDGYDSYEDDEEEVFNANNVANTENVLIVSGERFTI